MDKTSYRVLTLTVGCMLLLSTTAQQAIAWDCSRSPGACGDCNGECTETGCENDCIPGYCCEDDNCEECPECDDCKSCNPVNCECESDCAAGQCCDDDDCVDNCPGGGCCDDGTCVSSCPGSECCDDGTCVSSCPGGECCDDGTCVSSCPGGECCDDGTCVSSCPDCYECVGGECIPCKCWDAGSPITGDISVYDAKLCEQITHTSSISDTDHWFLGGDGHGYPSDSLTYSWSASAGTPATSTTANFTWTAPPCIGPVTITLTADDVPDSMDNPCPDSTRDDDSNNFDDVSTVSLPSGCFNAGPHDSSVYWIDDTNYYASPAGVWGFMEFWPAAYTFYFRYSTCTWVCEITNVDAVTDLEVWHPNRPGYVSITQASEVPCDPPTEPPLAKSDLNDSDLTDDVGAPLTKYWIHSAIIAHEEKHRTDWKDYYGSSLNTAISIAETITVYIFCDDPHTTTCQAAKSYWTPEIEDLLFDWAWDYALAEFDDPFTPVDESEVRAYLVENAIEQPVSDALPGGCGP